MMRRGYRFIGVVLIAVSALAVFPRAQTSTVASATTWTGEWVLDERGSDGPVMGAGAPRQPRWEPATLSLLSQERSFVVERKADNGLTRRVFSATDGESRTAGSTTSRLTWVAAGPVFEIWEVVALPGGTDTIYECERWTRDASNTLVVSTEVRTERGTITRRTVYRLKGAGER